MKPSFPMLALFAAWLPLFAACGGNEAPSAHDTSASLLAFGQRPAPGASSQILLGEPSGQFAESFITPDGKGILLAAAHDGQAAQAYYAFFGNEVRRTPPPDSPMQPGVLPESAAPIALADATVASLAGRYSLLHGGQQVDFAIAPEGGIAAGASPCRVSGRVAPRAQAGGTLPVTVQLQACGGASGSYEGHVVATPEYAPAAFRLVASDGRTVLDWLAFLSPA